MKPHGSNFGTPRTFTSYREREKYSYITVNIDSAACLIIAMLVLCTSTVTTAYMNSLNRTEVVPVCPETHQINTLR